MPSHTFDNEVVYYFHMLIILWLTCTEVYELFLVLVPTPKNLLIEISIFRFILIYTWVIQMRKEYIIIYVMEKHNSPWTSDLDFFNRSSIILLRTISYFLSQDPVDTNHKNPGNKYQNRVKKISTNPSDRAQVLLFLTSRFQVLTPEWAFSLDYCYFSAVDTCFIQFSL